MTNRDKFVLLFINKFYQKGIKVPSENNQVHWTVKTINDTCKNHFDNKLSFTQEEILNGFKRNKYTVSVYSNKEFTWEKFHSNHITILNDKFVNIKDKNNKDLSNTWKTHKPNYKLETIIKIDNLKEDLLKFWEYNKQLVENSVIISVVVI